jgi:TPR repeat protein
MSSIKAGVVVVNKFCPSDSKAFSGYISYIDRPDAKRNEKLSEYNLYNDYMDNPEKTTGLFTQDKTELTYKDKQILKETFQSAQDNGSLMWQTVISFDNRWLEKYGLYDAANDVVDERKLKEIASNAIEKMLANEGLENAVWSGAIHYNTDNLHVHVAVVEPVPQREVKEYVQYEYREDPKGKYVKDNYGEFVFANKSFVKQRMEDGLPVTRYEKVPLLDKEGNPVVRKQYIGKFKQKSIEMCKQYVVNEIAMQRDQNLQINRIIREQIVKQKASHNLIQDQELVNKFLDVYKQLPRTGNRGLWNYNNNAMKKVRRSLDELSSFYMQKYNMEDYKNLRELIARQSLLYREAYGQTGRDYEQTKMKDLYERLGNAILKEMRDFDKNYAGDINDLYNENHIEQVLEPVFTEKYDLPDEIDNTDLVTAELEKNTGLELDEGKEMVFEEGYVFPEMEWKMENSTRLKDAKSMIYGVGKNFDRAIELLKEESRNGNVLAVYELGSVYRYGRGREINLEAAGQYYKKALEMFEAIYDEADAEMEDDAEEDGYDGRVSRGYVAYRIGKQHLYGQGTDIDYEKAMKWFNTSIDEKCRYAHYNLAGMYYEGKGTEQDIEKAVEHYQRASYNENPYASYKLAGIYKQGIGIEADPEMAAELYETAFDGFLKLERKNRDDNLQYRIGVMYEGGIGTEPDQEIAERYFKLAAEAGNSNAQYKLAQMYLKKEEPEYTDKARRLLTESAIKGKNAMAQYALGRIAEDKNNEKRDLQEAVKWYDMAVENENYFAAYRAGKILNDHESGLYDREKAVSYLKIGAEHNNEYAQYELGVSYLEKEGYDLKEALAWLERSSEKNVQALYKLGNLYQDMESEIFDMDKAVQYYEKAALQGHETSLYRLGKIYRDKENPDYYNMDRAVECFESAAGKENEYAMYQLGCIYMDKDIEKYHDVSRALSNFEKAAEKGFDPAKYKAGCIYLDRGEKHFNPEKGLKYMQELADGGNAAAQYRIGKLYLDRTYEMYDLDRAVENFEKAGALDHKPSLYQLGCIYGDPENETYYDEKKALKYFETSMTKEFTPGKYRAAKIYLDREGSSYDLKKGMQYMQELADDGNDMAQYALGQLYEDRELEVFDLDKAVENYTHAANQENRYAQYRLGNIYADQDNKELCNMDEALACYERAVKNDFDPARYKAGKIYLDKEGAHYDLDKGMDYMRTLADKENDMAQYTLGRILLDPESGVYDAKEGMEYLTRSAEHGNEYAQLKLGLVYLSGADRYPGVAKDKEMARHYLELAAEKNDLAKDILSNIDNYRGGLPFVIAGKNRISLRGNSSYELEKALHNIEKSMGDELQKYINMREFEKLKDKEIREAEKEKNKEKDKEIDQEHE